MFPSIAKYSAVVFLSILFLQAFAQQERTFSQNKAFIKYLMDNKEYSDALYVINTSSDSILKPSQKDSMLYFKGLILHRLKHFDSSFFYLNKIPFESDCYYDAAYYNIINKALSEDYDLASKLAEEIKYDTILSHLPLKCFEEASLALIKRDYKKFDQLSTKFDTTYLPIQIEQKELITRRTELENRKKKYPIVAGTLSAIVPGLGKIYAGSVGQGIAAFMMVGMLAGITAETLYRSGPKNPQFIVMGSFFTVFYIGNIYGSVFSVKLSNDKYNGEVNKILLFNMRIPVSRIFNY